MPELKRTLSIIDKTLLSTPTKPPNPPKKRKQSRCIHNKQKAQCKECGGSAICIHNKQKSTCKECGGSEICIHNKQKAQCKECGGSAICIHNKHKSICKECGGSAICIHNKQKSTCKECGGRAICIHNRRKTRCKECGGSEICPLKYCEKKKNKKYKNYCMRCCIHLFPDTKIPRNYKTKENAVVQYIKEQHPDFDWVADKKIIDGCSHRRPDLFLDMGSHVIIIEIDEFNHIFYNKECEEKRIHQIVEDTGFRHVVFIRFNPDGYIDESTGNKVKSCWTYTKTGLLKLHKDKEEEWKIRLQKLSSVLNEWLCKVPTDLVEIIKIFY